MIRTFGAKIATFVRSDRHAYLVTDGRLSCPYSRGDVDVDRCFSCARFRGTFDGKAGEIWLRCDATRRPPAYRL